ncbi:MAG: hypothetical protein HY398_00230 [Candidatus Doudnabacteria bacterium]|nr:hypothetical protein [Candidatus Doudnabacteria bacterium]
MRYVVGYDRDFATQYFRRSVLPLLALPPFKVIADVELNYLASRFGEDVCVPLYNELARPPERHAIELLLDIRKVRADRRLSQMAEGAANGLLFYQGLPARGGLRKLRRLDMNRRQVAVLIKKLYNRAALAKFRTSDEKGLFHRLSEHIPEWLDLLSLIPGNDFVEVHESSTSLLFGVSPSTKIN